MFNQLPDFQQSVEMMQNMWANASKANTDKQTANFGLPGMASLNPFGIPSLDLEELEKRIKDLKSVEAWLTLNLNVLQTTIQGLEVQKATLTTLQGIADTMKAASATDSETTKASPLNENMAQASGFANAGGKLAQELMAQMSKSVSNMMTGFPSATSATAKKTAARKTGAAKTSARKAAPRTAKKTATRSR